MLTNEEKGFIEYWAMNRLRKKRIWRQLSVGLPLGVAIGGAILVNICSGWNTAESYLKNSGDRFLIVLLGILLIVIFIVIFSARHRWDMNEQHYKELIAKKEIP